MKIVTGRLHQCLRAIIFIACTMTGILAESVTATAAETENLTLPISGLYAIVTGVSQYTEASIGPVRHAENDAALMQRTLEMLGYKVFTETDGLSARNLKARINRINREIVDDGVRREDATLIVTFAGHGFSDDGKNYLIFKDATSAADRAHTLAVSELLDVMGELEFGRQFLFLDACRTVSVRAMDRASRPPFINEMFDDPGEGQGIIYSAAFDEYAYESESLSSDLLNEKGHGVFTYYLSEALISSELSADGQLTFDEVYEYVRPRVENYVHKKLSAEQSPVRDGEMKGNLLIASGPGTPELGDPGNGWVAKALGIGAILIGIAALAGGDSGSGSGSEEVVTLQIPTP